MYNSYEDELQLLVDKVEGIVDKGWDELIYDLDIDIHPDSLRKSFNVGRYSGYRVYKYFEDKFKNEYCSTEEVERLESLKEEIYKEKVKYQDARREYRKYLRNEARYENLVSVLRDGLKDLSDLPDYKFGEMVKENITQKCAILQLSDWHIGAVVDSPWNYYSVDTARRRMIQLTNKVKSYALEYRITDIVVEINGDMIHGIINTANRVESEEDAVSQVITVSEMLSHMINELKPYFKSIKVVTTLGNHGRLVPDKRSSITRENMEMLIPEFLRLRLGSDIPVVTSYGLDFMKYEFDGKVICLAHGHNDKISKVIESFSSMYKQVPDEIHLGHTHSHVDMNESNIYITVNGSLMGSDEYAVSLRKNAKPSQNLIIYGQDRGVFELVLD